MDVLPARVECQRGSSWAFFEVIGISLAIGHLYYSPGRHVTRCYEALPAGLWVCHTMTMENETAMTNLSPAAQAVLDAYNDATSRVEPDLAVIAAALRAAADQVVPEFWHEDNDIYGETLQEVRENLLAIADELEDFGNR